MEFKVSAIGLACGALLAACGGGSGSGSGSGSGGAVQSLSFEFPGGGLVGVPPTVTTVPLKATASSGGPVTFSSNTPKTCAVSGSTLSLLAAGECSVTATQSGYQGYATVSESQLFVIPKQPQTISVFRNPGAQPLDSTPVPLAATSDLGRPVTFSSKTPTICSVSGATMTKLTDGLCTVTATQDGGDIYVSPSLDRVIPIGSAQAPELTFLSGYKDLDTTLEGGGLGHNGNWWWCQDCDRSLSADGSTFSFTGFTTNPSTARFWFHAAGLKADSSDAYKLVANANTPTGVRIDAQAALRFKLAQNAEWFGSANNAVNVELILGHYNLDPSTNKACNVRVKATFKPTAAASTAYAIGLKDKFALSQSCGLAGLNVWNELQDYPVSVIEFSAAAPIGGGSKFTLTGPITFQ